MLISFSKSWDSSISLIGVKILLDIAGISNGFFDINIPYLNPTTFLALMRRMFKQEIHEGRMFPIEICRNIEARNLK